MKSANISITKAFSLRLNWTSDTVEYPTADKKTRTVIGAGSFFDKQLSVLVGYAVLSQYCLKHAALFNCGNHCCCDAFAYSGMRGGKSSPHVKQVSVPFLNHHQNQSHCGNGH
jgi:hypothetical protein